MKKNFVLVFVVLMLFAFSGSVFAWPPGVEGHSGNIQEKGQRAKGYYIWHDEKGLHLRTVAHGMQHEFRGVIRTDGEFMQIRGARLERDDFFRMNHRRDRITFKFETNDGKDGLDVRIDEGSYVHFELYIDGHRIDPREVYLGDRGRHPRHWEFTLWR